MKNISSRKFVFCNLFSRDIPHEGEGCCEFFDKKSGSCDYDKYIISSRDKILKNSRLSQREEIYKDFNSFDD